MFEIIGHVKQKHSVWPGGKTTELAVYPAESSYSDRSFSVRVSSATIELNTSEFTRLPGFTRLLMPLSGGLKLTHEGHSGMELKPFEVHKFDGAWRTVSEGVCTDFNHMLRYGWGGEMSSLLSGDNCFCEPSQLLWIYCLKPLTVNSGFCNLNAGDILFLNNCKENFNISVTSYDTNNEVVAVFAKAWKDDNK